MKTAVPLLLAVLLCAAFPSCAQMSANDGLVPRMSAQANLPYVPTVLPNGMLGASSGSSSVSPLAETRKAYWSTP